MMKPHAAIEQLYNHQQPLDLDGIRVGVSRQDLEEVLEFLEWLEAQAPGPGPGHDIE